MLISYSNTGVIRRALIDLAAVYFHGTGKSSGTFRQNLHLFTNQLDLYCLSGCI